MTYVSGTIAAVPEARKDDYIAFSRKTWPLFRDYGALSIMENWGDMVPDGKLTSFPMAVKLEEGEVVVFSWILWPDKASSDACWSAMESDARWGELGEMPFDGKRMIFGGFETILEESA